MRADLNGVTVIFDLDGTLIDTADDLAAAMNHALRLAGRPVVPGERVRHLVGHGARAMLARGFEESGPAPSADEMDGHLAAFLDHYLSHIADLSLPFPGMVETAETLRAAGAKLAICTNKREAPARQLIETLGLSVLFETIVGMDTASAPKPDAAPVRLCLDRTSAVRGVFVGDSDTDIRAAAAAGLPCLIADFGYGPFDLVDQAAARFSDYAALPRLIAAALR